MLSDALPICEQQFTVIQLTCETNPISAIIVIAAFAKPRI